MADYHYFSHLLHKLLQQANIKNQAVANIVRYDVSYVSKWINGKALPSEVYVEEVVSNISNLIISSSTDNNLTQLFIEYNCIDESALNQSLQNALLKAYTQDKESLQVQNSPLEYHVSLSTLQIVYQIREKTGDEKVGLFDLFAMDHSSRLLLSGIVNGQFEDLSKNSEVHFSLGFFPFSKREDTVYNTISMIHMLTSYSGIDFNLYALPYAARTCVCSVKGCYSISGILFNETECLNVMECRNESDINSLYQKLSMLMVPDQLVFRKTTIYMMLHNQLYAQSLIAGNARWLLGHVTEHLLPDNIFEELTKEKYCGEQHMLQRLHQMTKEVLKHKSTRIMLYDSALAKAAGSGEIDFFNEKCILNEKQKMEFFSYLNQLVKSEELRLEIVCEGFSSDFQHITNPCIFLADTICYLRLENERYEDNLLILQNQQVKDMFDEFYDIIWAERKDSVIRNLETITYHITQYAASIEKG